MTIADAIARVDATKHNTYTEDEKVTWLSQLDGMIKKQIIDTHDGAEDVTFDGYNAETDKSTTLLVPPPHDDIYLRWIEAQIDFANGEYNKYNNSIIMYNAIYDSYANYYNRNHMPLSRCNRLIF